MERDEQPSGNNPLWAFADALYSSPAVEETCLNLQDHHGANVNLLLWCCWLETRGVELTRPLLDKAQHAIQQWDADVVQTLRRVRRLVKQGALRNSTTQLLSASVQEAELLAELHEQDVLYEISRELRADEDLTPGGNLRLYLVGLGLRSQVDAITDVFGRAMKNLGDGW